MHLLQKIWQVFRSYGRSNQRSSPEYYSIPKPSLVMEYESSDGKITTWPARSLPTQAEVEAAFLTSDSFTNTVTFCIYDMEQRYAPCTLFCPTARQLDRANGRIIYTGTQKSIETSNSQGWIASISYEPDGKQPRLLSRD